MILTGAGQIGMAIARRVGYGMKIVIGDKNMANAEAIAGTMNAAGFDAVPVEMDLSSRASIMNLIAEARKSGEISMLVNAAGVSPSQGTECRRSLQKRTGCWPLLQPRNCSRWTCFRRGTSVALYMPIRWRNAAM